MAITQLLCSCLWQEELPQLPVTNFFVPREEDSFLGCRKGPRLHCS